MYGPGYHHHGLRYWRGPSRLLWFFLGAGAATFWIKRKECRDGNSWSRHCVRAPIQPPTFSSGESTSWSPRDIPRAINNIPVGEYSNNQPRGTQAWEEERERMLALSQKAGDKVGEFQDSPDAFADGDIR